jgi:hypothetical protein
MASSVSKVINLRILEKGIEFVEQVDNYQLFYGGHIVHSKLNWLILKKPIH